MFKRTVSFLLVSCMSVSVGVSTFAAQKTGTGTTASTPVSTVETKTVVYPQSSGKTFGPWFGDRTESYTTKGDAQVGTYVYGAILIAISPKIGDAVAATIVAGLGSTLQNIAFTLPDDYVYGTIHKRQREVFVNGTFEYFQTQVTVKSYMHRNGKNTYIGTSTKMMEGNSPAVKED